MPLIRATVTLVAAALCGAPALLAQRLNRAKGITVVLITHEPNILYALGKDWFGVKEGEASIFRPENGSYKLIARVQMDEWPRLAAAK